jgi:hypothetical protein
MARGGKGSESLATKVYAFKKHTSADSRKSLTLNEKLQSKIYSKEACDPISCSISRVLS